MEYRWFDLEKILFCVSRTILKSCNSQNIPLVLQNFWKSSCLHLAGKIRETRLADSTKNSCLRNIDFKHEFLRLDGNVEKSYEMVLFLHDWACTAYIDAK